MKTYFAVPALASLFAFALLTMNVQSSIAEDETSEKEKGWIQLFDGKSLGDWKPNERPESWSVKEGCIIANGERSHLFYMGKENQFENFHLRVELKADPNSNSGIYFHTKWQDEGWPKCGYECQVNVSHGDPVKSGSLYNTVKIFKEEIAKAGLKDNAWWTQEIMVLGKHVVVKLNGKTVVDYTEPDQKKGTVKLGRGIFALQAHDRVSKVYYRKIEVMRLP